VSRTIDERTVLVEEIGDDTDRGGSGFPVLRVLVVITLVIVFTGGSGSAGAAPRAVSDASGGGGPAALFIGPTVGPGAPSVAPTGGSGPADDSAMTAPATPAITAKRTALAAFTTTLPDGRARVAISAAMAQIGLPYIWGGDGPAAGDAGFDCSGLTTFSYAAAGLRLPRTAHTQYYAGPHVPAGAPLQPGDLVFYGTPSKVHHVGMYIGAGRMVNAPTFGKPVQTAYYRWGGDDYLGATRPAATDRPTIGVLPAPPPAPTAPDTVPDAPPHTVPVPPVFAAPPAPLPVTPLPDPTVPQPPEPQTAADAIAATEGLTIAGQPPLAPPFPTPFPAPATTAQPPPMPPAPAPTTTPPPTSPIATTATPGTPAAPSATPAPPSPTTSPSPASGGPSRSAPPAATSSAPPSTSRTEQPGTPTPTPTPTPRRAP
jgi:cell wall-associated NlpC family hydrolase